MTINQLIKKLEKLRDKHGKTVPVVCRVDKMWDSVNRTWNLIEVVEAQFDVHELVDDDGFKEYKSNGEEKMKRMIVLS